MREINDPPDRLFVRGLLPDHTSTFLCVVGSRKATPYGIQACKELIAGLKGTNIVIVSGLALGIDSIAHQAALDAGLKTIAVLGSGLDWSVIYPQSHLNLAKEILAAGGAIISEQTNHNHRPYLFNFPERNRIMTGMSHATLIIEANMKSGTLITARLALDYNRDVLAVPGSIFSSNSDGPHMLIKNGAAPVTSAQDILNALKIDSQSISNKYRILEDCTPLERKIYETLSEPMSRTELLQKINGDVKEINIALSLLEMKGFVGESGGVLGHLT